MKNFVDLDINNKVNGVKEVNDNYVNPGNSIEITNYDSRLMGATHKGSGVFEGYYITLSTDKKAITADGIDKAIINATVYNYDDTQAINFANGIIFDENDIQNTVIPTNGIASIEFTSFVVGNFTIKTVNDVIRNGEVNIIAS